MTCSLCSYDVTDTHHFALYVNGSEGLNLCHQCEMTVVTMLRQMMNVAARAKLAVAKKLDKERTGAGRGESDDR